MQYRAEIIRNGVRFVADMSESNGQCVEQVNAFNHNGGLGLAHGAMFAASCLGSADRDEYVRTMLASAADSYFRKMREYLASENRMRPFDPADLCG